VCWSEAVYAARLEPDEGISAPEERRKRGDAPLRLASRLLDEADRKERAPAAEWPLAVGWFRQLHLVTAGGEHGERRLDVLRDEGPVESIGQGHDRARTRAARGGPLAPCVGTPARQVASRAQARVSLRPLPQARRVIPQVSELGPFGCERRVAG